MQQPHCLFAATETRIAATCWCAAQGATAAWWNKPVWLAGRCRALNKCLSITALPLAKPSHHNQYKQSCLPFQQESALRSRQGQHKLLQRVQETPELTPTASELCKLIGCLQTAS